MEIYSSLWHLASAFLLVILGASISWACASYFKIKRSRTLLIYAWHTMFCMVYLWYAMTDVADATMYYQQARSGYSDFSFGTGGVNYLTTLLVDGFDVSMLGAFLAFNIFGVVGLLSFDACLRIATQNKPIYLRYLATIIVFLPSVSFWSSAIGKDSLSFMATCLALWASIALGRRWLLMFFAVIVMLLVRPHVAGMMVIAWSFAVLVDRKTPFRNKVFLGSLLTIMAVTMVPLAIQFSGLGENIGAEELSAYVEKRQTFNTGGGSSVNIASMSLPMQLFTYMFRPVIFEANTFFALAAAFDNLILLFLFAMGVRMLLLGNKSGLGESRMFMWAYALLAWLLMAMTTANLGIALRQKWMFAPMLIFLMISLIGVKKRKKSNAGQAPIINHVSSVGVTPFRTQ